jgi:WS/DGAT/MGAT family acyltransferase
VLASLTDVAPDTPLARPARPALALVHARTPHGPHPAAALAALGRLVLRPGDPPTVLKGALGVRKLAAWSTPVPLETVRAIGHAVGGTVNDALTAAVAGMLRRHLLARREPIVTRSLRAIVPVDLHPPEAGTHLGNRFGLVFAALPVGLDDPLARLHAVKHGMDALKHSSESTVALGLLHALGMLNASVERMAVSLFGHKASLVLTDLPGPQAPRYLAGERIRSAMFWPPQAGHLGLGVSLLSYAGEVRVGIAADAGLVPSPADLAADFVREIDALRACTGLLH